MSRHHDHGHVFIRAVVTGVYQLDRIQVIQRLHFLVNRGDVRLKSIHDGKCLGTISRLGHFDDTKIEQQLFEKNLHERIVLNNQNFDIAYI